MGKQLTLFDFTDLDRAEAQERRSKTEVFEDYEGFTEKFKPKKTTDDCKTIKVEISKTELKRHLKAGEDCGAHLEENQSLQIK